MTRIWCPESAKKVKVTGEACPHCRRRFSPEALKRSHPLRRVFDAAAHVGCVGSATLLVLILLLILCAAAGSCLPE